MPIRRSKSQVHSTLQEFYEEFANGDHEILRRIGKTMLQWIKRIDESLPYATIYGLTSHMHLVLMPGETYRDDWAVRLMGTDNDYSVQYLMPKEDAPWPNAYVTGEFSDFDEAVEMSLKAIKLCGLWSAEELHRTK